MPAEIKGRQSTTSNNRKAAEMKPKSPNLRIVRTRLITHLSLSLEILTAALPNRSVSSEILPHQCRKSVAQRTYLFHKYVAFAAFVPNLLSGNKISTLTKFDARPTVDR